MKMTISGLFVGTAALALAACGGEAPAAEEAAEETSAEVVPVEPMAEETPEPAAADDGEVPLDGTGTPIGPSIVETEE